MVSRQRILELIPHEGAMCLLEFGARVVDDRYHLHGTISPVTGQPIAARWPAISDLWH